jgi:hypothetical protein
MGMDLSIDDQLVDADVDAESLGRALGLFRALGHKRLELRKKPNERLTLSRWDDEVFVEVERPGRVEGVLMPSWDAAARAAADYLASKPVKAPPLKKGLTHLIFGTPYEPDCPLCRAMGPA